MADPDSSIPLKPGTENFPPGTPQGALPPYDFKKMQGEALGEWIDRLNYQDKLRRMHNPQDHPRAELPSEKLIRGYSISKLSSHGKIPEGTEQSWLGKLIDAVVVANGGKSDKPLWKVMKEREEALATETAEKESKLHRGVNKERVNEINTRRQKEQKERDAKKK